MSQTEVEEPALQLQTASELNKGNKGFFGRFLVLDILTETFYADTLSVYVLHE